MKKSRWFILLLAMFAGQVFAVESGTLLYDAVLHEKAKAKSKVIARIDKGVKVELLRVSGNWFFVKVDNKWTGWVPVAAIRRHDSTFGGGVNDLRSTSGMPTLTKDALGSMPSASGSAFNRQ